MPFIPFRGRFRRRHADFDRTELRSASDETPILAPDSLLVDIAGVHFNDVKFGTVRVKCWPAPEGAGIGRRWGKYNSADVVIMPFRTKAYLSTTTVRLATYELELFLCSETPELSKPLLFSSPCPFGQHGRPCDVHSNISLVELPAPEVMTGDFGGSSQYGVPAHEPWKFRSEVGCSCDNSDRAAKWIWDANGHDPIALHGGLAIQHPGHPFLIACRVRGLALTLDSSFRLRSILRFDNKASNMKWWRVEPKDSHEDISTNVKQLEHDIQSLNKSPGSKTFPGPNSSLLTRPIAEADRSRDQIYGTTSIGGSANVVLGNVTYMSSPDPHRFPTPSQQNDPPVANLSLCQGTAGR